MSHLENNYIFGILASSWLIWLIWKWHSSTFNFWPLITLWVNFDAPYLKLLNDASVASACFYVRTYRRVRNSKKIATIRDFHLPGSFLCLSTRLGKLLACNWFIDLFTVQMLWKKSHVKHVKSKLITQTHVNPEDSKPLKGCSPFK